MYHKPVHASDITNRVKCLSMAYWDKEKYHALNLKTAGKTDNDENGEKISHEDCHKIWSMYIRKYIYLYLFIYYYLFAC